jgi:hypothetical protein
MYYKTSIPIDEIKATCGVSFSPYIFATPDARPRQRRHVVAAAEPDCRYDRQHRQEHTPVVRQMEALPDDLLQRVVVLVV